MKKLGLHIFGVLLLSSFPVNGVFAFKRRFYDCQSDKKITTQTGKRKFTTVPEYIAVVSDFAGTSARLRAERNVVLNNKIKNEVLMNQIARFENTGKYITIQSLEWSIAIAPEKKRGSLYHSNPDINEVPMFCLSH